VNHWVLALLTALIVLYPPTANAAQAKNITMLPTATSQDPSHNSTIQILTLNKNRLQKSFDRWNVTYIVALVLTVLVVVLAGISQFQTINRARSLVAVQSKIERESDRLLRVELSGKDSQIAELNRKAGELNKIAGEALERAGKAEAHLAEANERTAIARREAAEANAQAKKFEAEIAGANVASKEAVAKVVGAEARIAEAREETEKLRNQNLALQERVLELQEKMAPRRLTAGQVSMVATGLAMFSGERLNMFVYTGDGEIIGIANDIIRALGEKPIGAGWTITVSTGQDLKRSVSGILVEIDSAGDDALRKAAEALVSELNKQRIETAGPIVGQWRRGGGTINDGTVSLNGPVDPSAHIKVTIGRKP